MTTTERRAHILSLVEQRIDDVKERLRLNHELGQDLVVELKRLEREEYRFLTHSERPVIVLTRSA